MFYAGVVIRLCLCHLTQHTFQVAIALPHVRP